LADELGLRRLSSKEITCCTTLQRKLEALLARRFTKLC